MIDELVPCAATFAKIMGDVPVGVPALAKILETSKEAEKALITLAIQLALQRTSFKIDLPAYKRLMEVVSPSSPIYQSGSPSKVAEVLQHSKFTLSHIKR